jgi:putative transposase
MRKNRNIFELFQLIDRKIFQRLVDKWEMDKGVRSFKTWEMTCALVTARLLKFSSYQDMEAILGIPHSTLGDALTNRAHGFFQDLCDEILLSIQDRIKSRKIRKAIRQILAIDSTECRVHGSLFCNPNWKPKNSHKDAHSASLKLHAVWNITAQCIEDFRLAPARRNDMPVARGFKIRPKTTYVFDRAYNAIDFWVKIILCKAHFVTRLKLCHLPKEQRKRVLSDKDGVLHDGVFNPSPAAIKKLPVKMRSKKLFRHIIFRDPKTKKVFDFATSDFNLSAEAIADIYKQRWAVELLFRWLKGHLNIRYLPTKTKNASKTQLAVAVLTQLLLRLNQINGKFQGALSELLRGLFSSIYRQGLTRSGVPADCRWSCPNDKPLSHESS